jgi:hypothetical protein
VTAMEPPAQTRPVGVRGDPTGRLQSALSHRIDTALELIVIGEYVRCPRELTAWRERSVGWRTDAARLLDLEFERETLAEFLYATLRPYRETERWHETLRDELRRLDDARELLIVLRTTLAKRGSRANLKPEGTGAWPNPPANATAQA